jgi:hypothetical protein
MTYCRPHDVHTLLLSRLNANKKKQQIKCNQPSGLSAEKQAIYVILQKPLTALQEICDIIDRAIYGNEGEGGVTYGLFYSWR